MIEQILIIKDSGVPLFSWLPEEQEDHSQMVSGFLTAINMFAQQQQGQQIKNITMDRTTFVFQRFEDNVIVILTQDEKFQKVLVPIINDIKENFIQLYGTKAANFTGSVSDFRPFSQEIERILEKYHYIHYCKTKGIFDQKDKFLCSILIDRTKGDIVYLISKEFLERELLGLQTSILVKAVERINAEILHEEDKLIVILTKKKKAIIIRYSDRMIMVQEVFHLFNTDQIDFLISTNKISKNIKKPGNLLFEIKTPFVITNPDGKGMVANKQTSEINKHDIVVDLMTILRSGSTMTTQIYKDEVMNILILTQQAIYSAFHLDEHHVFLKSLVEHPERIESQIEDALYTEHERVIQTPDISHIFTEIRAFKKQFQ